MTQQERIAIGRIINDIVKADDVVDSAQLEQRQILSEKYRITLEDHKLAQKIPFAEAINTLLELPRPDRKELVEQLASLIHTGRQTIHREAMYMTVLNMCLPVKTSVPGGEKPLNPFIIQTKTTSKKAGQPSILYIEKEYNDEYNDELKDKNTYELISSKCRLSGYDFVYIPQITKSFAEMDKDYVKDVLQFIMPDLDRDFAGVVASRMADITSSEFYYKVLANKLSSLIKEKAGDETAMLLVNANVSMTPYCPVGAPPVYYKEYLCLPITPNGSVLETVDKFLNQYLSESPVIALSPLAAQRTGGVAFRFFDFYRSFFSYLLTPPPVLPDLIFLGQDLKDGKYHIAFRFADNERRIALLPKEYDTLLEIMLKTFRSKQHGMSIGLNRTQLAPIISHIRKKIAAVLPEIALAEKYLPQREGNVYTTQLEKQRVFVKQYNIGSEDAEYIPITQYHY